MPARESRAIAMPPRVPRATPFFFFPSAVFSTSTRSCPKPVSCGYTKRPPFFNCSPSGTCTPASVSDTDVCRASWPTSEVERLVLLQSIDALWVEHLTELDDMRRGIGLRGYAQQDPLNEFRKEAFSLYEELRARLLSRKHSPDARLSLHALAAELGVSQPAVSQHLAVLRAADLVIGERRGYHVHYRLDANALSAYRAQVLALLGDAFMASPPDAPPAPGRRGRSLACQVDHMHDD